jgi:WD40 repeat protein
VRFLHGHAGRVKAVAFAPLGTGGGAPRLASAAANETGVRLWDVAERKQLETLEGFQREVLALAFSPTGDRLAAGSMDGTARIWTLSE